MLLKTCLSWESFFMSKINTRRCTGESGEYSSHQKQKTNKQKNLSSNSILHKKNNFKGIRSNIRKD